MRTIRRGNSSTWGLERDRPGEPLVIRDLNGKKSVTNDAEHVVDELQAGGLLTPGRRLFYYDSTGRLDEIAWTAETGFAGFRMLPKEISQELLASR